MTSINTNLAELQRTLDANRDVYTSEEYNLATNLLLNLNQLVENMDEAEKYWQAFQLDQTPDNLVYANLHIQHAFWNAGFARGFSGLYLGPEHLRDWADIAAKYARLYESRIRALGKKLIIATILINKPAELEFHIRST